MDCSFIGFLNVVVVFALLYDTVLFILFSCGPCVDICVLLNNSVCFFFYYDLSVMESKFECVVHHGGCFGQLHHADYNGAEESWFFDPDYWAYFDIKDNLKEKLGYKVVESLWFYDPMNINGMVYLQDDVGANRMIHIAQMHEKVHLYAVHPLSQPNVVEDIPLLEYNVVGPNERNLDDGLLGTNEKGPNEDSEVVMDKGPNEVDLDDGSEQVGEGINVETDEVGEQSEDSALDIHFDDSEEDIGLEDTFGEHVVRQSGQSEQVNAAEQVTKVQKKGKDKEAGGSKPKRKRGRPFKQAEASGYDSNVNCDDGDIVTKGDQSTKINYRGLGDSDDYNSDEIQSGCDSDDEDDVDKEKFPTFKLLKDMKDYKWELGTYFQTKEEFQEGMKTYSIHSNRGLRFKKNDKEKNENGLCERL
jgi:hypothetical protein